jgi:hypothetical protein
VKTTPKTVMFTFLLNVLVAPLWAQGTYTAASCNYSDVNAVINGPTHTAVDGDIINIPAGSCTWSSGVVIPNHIGISILGSGTPNSTSSTTGASSSCGSNTTITVTSGATLFRMTPEYGNSTTRLSCMVIAAGSGAGIAASMLGTCTSSGCPNLRMDNITFSNWANHANAGISYGINAVGDMFGVVDHNTINGSAGAYLQMIEQSNASYLGVGYYGDNSWAQPESYGSANFLFFENNLLNYAGLTEDEGSAGGLQNQGGGRVVARYNTFNTDNANYELTWHGTESNQRARSSRTFEFYQNTVNCPASTECQDPIQARGGTGLAWGNTMTFGTSSGVNTWMNLLTFRTQANIGGWGVCDGSAPYDTNDGITYYSGTVGSVAGTTITVSGNSPGWSTNQWSPNGAPYSVHDVTQSTGSEIIANGANTLTIAYSGVPGSWTPSPGDSIQILRATACVDQGGGRGAGILYNSSDNPANATPANEVPSPTYAWMNTFSGSTPATSVVYSDTARVIRNRDYYSETVNQSAQTSSASPFDGTTNTTGIGHGTLANRPTSCTPSSNTGTVGTGYWETDNNQLDFCIATNTWSTTNSSPASYTPYAYPHPLESGGTTVTVIPPTTLQATVQ